ncbi:glycosyltransferase BC10-like [Lolium rigidum]|uniref:glycosyltransferase BC10-like n=1 Tax=Lolium rigidum TaxID=89674 RepID=UPI001F5DF8DB|nr:glycosyltransferase BC10-like [Lolium rigidum]
MKNPMPVPRSGSVGVVLLLLVFCLAYVLGLMSSAIFQNIYIHNTLSPLQLSVFWSQSSSPSSPPPPPEAIPCILPPSPPSQTTVPRIMSMAPSGGRRMEFTDFLAPSRGLMHNMTDEELFWRASMAPSMKSMPKHVIVHKIAFLFLVRGELPLRPLWDKFFKGHEGLYSIYVHASPSYTGSPPPDSPFYGRMIPSQTTKWGHISLVDAERRLLGNSLLDLSNGHFALLSESCIPLFDFPAVHAYITGSNTNFVDSFDREESRERHSPFFAAHNVSVAQWRKGAQWFVMDRVFALEVVSDETYYGPVFRNGRHQYMDEHYIPTLVNILGLGHRNSNRSVMYSDWWTPRVRHPKSHSGSEVTEVLIKEMRRGMDGNCSYNGRAAEFCALFARKFRPDALLPLLDLAPKVMGFG